MSRIIVKNLPKHITEERVREHFSQKGEVTDVKLKYTKEGAFRRFGFVGYRTAESAEQAVKYFQGTYVDTSKIEVDLAKTINDPTLDRPWSRYSTGSSAHTKVEEGVLRKKMEAMKKEQSDEKVEVYKKKQRELAKEKKAKALKTLSDIYGIKDMNDPELQEFLEVSKSRSSAKTWSNEDTALYMAQKKDEAKIKTGMRVKVEAVDAKRPAVEGTLHTRTHITFDDSEGDQSDDDYQDLPAAGDTEETTPMEKKESDEDEVTKEALQSKSDLDYFKAKMTLGDNEGEGDDDIEMEGDEEGEEEEEGEKEEKEEDDQELDTADAENTVEVADDNKDDEKVEGDARRVGKGGEVATEQSIAETGRLFVRNLPYTCMEEDLSEYFKKFGPLSEVHMPLDKETHKPKGMAYILYTFPEHAIKAFADLDGQIFQGRILHILPARALVEKKKEDVNSKSFKGKKDAQKKADAEMDYNWNSLFIRSDTVASALAEKLKVAKGDILSKDADSMAVRMALGETHIIQETKQHLQEEGVRLEVFERAGKQARSKTVMIVKNVPFEITEDEIRALFGKHGEINRVVLPPTRTIALVEFAEPTEARVAFRTLAYSKFKTVPLYLEWAPEDVFEGPYDPNASEKLRTEKETKDKVKEKDMEEEEEDTSNQQLSVFIKNLNFDTTEETLQKIFSKAGKLRNVRVATKADPKNPGKTLSMGFGFAEYRAKEGAQNALKILQHVKVDGHVLELKISKNDGSKKPSRRNDKEGNKIQGSKLLIRNVPFEANRKELQELFSPFGQLKTVRVPLKFDGTHRGFAFIDFVSKQEAKNAMEALRSTHFYGRHLVIEYAKEDPNIDSLREMTAKHYVGDDEPASKRRKVNVMGKD